MISAEKENVKFLKAIDVNEGSRKGNVEIWLKEIETLMMDTLREITRNSICDTKVERIEWVRRWPGQVILSVNMSRWTTAVKFKKSKIQKIRKSKKKEIKKKITNNEEIKK
jgi:dynein heavy chain, axonemal